MTKTSTLIHYVNTNKLSIQGQDGSRSFLSIWKKCILIMKTQCLKSILLRSCELNTGGGWIIIGLPFENKKSRREKMLKQHLLLLKSNLRPSL